MKQPALLIVAMGLVGGVALASWLPWEVAALAALVCSLVAMRWRIPFPLSLAALLLGIIRIASAPLAPPPDDVASQAGRTVSGTGVVQSFPEPGEGRQRAVVEIESGQQRGNVLVYAQPHPPLAPGDVLEIKGAIKEPPVLEGFDYRRYLARDGIHSIMYRPELKVVGHQTQLNGLLYPARQAFLERLSATFNEPAAGFLAAILIGDRTGIPDSIVESFRRTGTIHVMALSGYNISILVAALIAIIGRGRSVVWLVFVCIAAFVIFVGPSASVVRAALMGGFLLLSQVFGRPQEATIGCIITAGAMLLLQPWALRYDLGFDLSFLATLGILLFEPGITARLAWMPKALRGIVSPTVAASIPTMPLIAASFGSVSVIAPVANLLIVPLIPWLMLGGFVATMVSFASDWAGRVIGLAVQAATDACLGLVIAMGRFSFASVDLGSLRVSFIVLTAAVSVALVLLKRKPHRA